MSPVLHPLGDPRMRENAILVPSGDHTGNDSSKAPGVRLIRSVPSASIVMRSQVPNPPSPTTTILPFSPGYAACAGSASTAISDPDSTVSAAAVLASRLLVVIGSPPRHRM